MEETISDTTGIPLSPHKAWPRVYRNRSSPRDGSLTYVVCPEWLSIRSLQVMKDDSGNLFAEWIVHSNEPKFDVPLWRRLAREVSFWWQFG